MSLQLWDWAVAAYRAPGVADACLDLQDSHEQNVPLLLWAAWTAATGRPVDADTIEAATDTARAWQDTTIGPLRAVRRTLKVKAPDLNDDDRHAIREQVKAVELDAERRLLIALAALSGDEAGAPRPVLPALIAVARVWLPVTPRPALARLADNLPA